jgi:MoxR-like ATPase
MGYPSPEDERAILRGEAGASRLAGMEPVVTMDDVLELQRLTREVSVTDAVLDYELALVEATRHQAGLELGVSPRGMLMLHRAAQAWALLEGRDYCIPGDVKRLLVAVCAHRVVTQARLGERHGDDAEQILSDIAASTPVPQ